MINSQSLVNPIVSYDPKVINGNQTFTGLEYNQEIYNKLLKSENIAELLYYISRLKHLQLTIREQKHFDLKFSCVRGENYRICDCPNCNNRHYIKTSCNSFFCEECRKFNISKIKRKAKEYLWNCNHFYATFTLPPEIQSKVEKWDKFFDKRYYKDKQGNIRTSEIYLTDLVYKSISNTIKEYYKKHNLQSGFIIMPHSHGSLEFNWNFHLNALISSKAFQDNKIVDYQFNYNELRAIYQKHLLRNFKIKFKDTPQVRFAKKKGTIYIPYKKAVRIVLDYFRHIPLGIKNIVKIKGDRIYYQSSKAKKINRTFDKSLGEFFILVMQHIPPSNFRTIRQYGLYSNKAKKRKKYPTSKPKKQKSMECEKCKTIIRKEDFVCMVHKGLLVWINPTKCNSIFNSKDFVNTLPPEIEKNGRVMQACEPPNSLKPKTPPQFPGYDTKDFSENFKSMEDIQW